MIQRQYVGATKLYSLGFEKKGTKYILETKQFDKSNYKVVRKVIGWVQLDSKGYLVKQQGFGKELCLQRI